MFKGLFLQEVHIQWKGTCRIMQKSSCSDHISVREVTSGLIGCAMCSGLLSDKIPRTVGFVNCFLKVPDWCTCLAAFCLAAKASFRNSQKK